MGLQLLGLLVAGVVVFGAGVVVTASLIGLFGVIPWPVWVLLWLIPMLWLKRREEG